MRAPSSTVPVVLLAAAWTIPGLVSLMQAYLSVTVLAGREVSWLTLFIKIMPTWWLWLAATPLTVHLARRFPFERGRLVRAAATHLFSSLAVAALHIALAATWIALVVPSARGEESTAQAALRIALDIATGIWLHADLFAYWATLGGVSALDFYRKFRDRELRASRVEAELARAQLVALKAQLHPHFLFNTLNAVSTLVPKRDHDEDAAFGADVLEARL